MERATNGPIDDDARRTLEAELRARLAGEVRFDRVSRGIYATDASVYQMLPAGVVIPKSEADLDALLDICARHGAPLTARGGGTSQAGQAIGSGVQVDFSKYLRRVLQFEPDRRSVVVEPGIVLSELNAFLKPYGLQLPLDLSTANRATIGGMISNNSAGTRSVVYGKTIDYVQELRVQLADRSRVQLRPLTLDDWMRKAEQLDLEGACYREADRLAQHHAAEIEQRYPKILRRVGGYNLDTLVDRSQPRSLADLLVGAEGTLGLVLQARLRLVPLPKARVVSVLAYDDLLEALAATPQILRHQPTAVELVDRFILDTTRGKPQFDASRSFLKGDPAAILIVEFSSDQHGDEVTNCLDRLERDLRDTGFRGSFHQATAEAEQERIWSLRRAALGLSMSQPGDAKAVSFVEDTAVAPDRLRDYIERFRQILAKYETQAGFYAHASVGLLHIRPVVNLKTADGIARFEGIAHEVADLVLEFGGALSGEHGDGLVRAPFQQKMFGEQLYEAFRQLKQTFDPRGLLNPGKIVDAPKLTDNLRYGRDYETKSVDTQFDFDDFQGVARAAEQCGGVGACRKADGGTMCPSFRATRDEVDSTRGRANALRLAIAGQLGTDGLGDAQLAPVLDLCVECKACKTECPTGVDLARLKSEFLHAYYQRHGAPLRTRLLAHLDGWARWGSRFRSLSNFLAGRTSVRWLLQRLLGLDSRRRLPKFNRQTFSQAEGRQAAGGDDRTGGGNGTADRPRMVLFVDTFMEYFEPQHGRAALRLAERLQADVQLAPRICCGRPLISKGFLSEARRQAEATTESLRPLAPETPIVFCEPSCYSAVRDDHPHLVGPPLRAAAREVAARCRTIEEWADEQPSERWEALRWEPVSRDLLLHGHCHQKALGSFPAALRMLQRLPGVSVRPIASGCCGMAGSFGYEQEHYELSEAIGESNGLFSAVRAEADQADILAPGFSCRHQIEHFTDAAPQSAIEYVAARLL